MTTYVGRDITFKINGSVVGKTQEVSFEIDNGRVETKELGTDEVVERNWTQQNPSGSFQLEHTSYTIINDVLTAGTTKTLLLEFGTIPDFSLTFSAVKYGSFELTFELEETVKLEVSWNAETVACA